MPIFIEKNKSSPNDFTRNRKLSFSSVFLLIFRNTVKSLQVMLNEYSIHRELDITITASAFTKARKKLRHTAFIELYEKLKNIYYKNDDVKKAYGFRIIGFDGSDIILPNTHDMRQEFGSIKTANGYHENTGDYARGKLEVGYDVLNNYVIACELGHARSGERELATQLLHETNNNDLLIFDRGYTSFEFISNLMKNNSNFLIRTPRKFNFEVDKMFVDGAPTSKIIELKIPKHLKKKNASLNLPNKIKLRLVKVILSTGEVEVLITSLLDSIQYPDNIFKDLYYLRWGIETFFSKIKSRLCLENFTGKTIESVKQDLWSTIMISNLETVITEDIDNETEKDCIEKRTVIKKTNKSVAFNAIKNVAFDLFTSKLPTEQILEKLTKLFKMNMNIIRQDRDVERAKTSITRSRNFYKRIKKMVF